VCICVTGPVIRYRRFTLGPYKLVCRTELHGYTSKKTQGKDEYVTAYALNEWETDEWRKKIDAYKGACGTARGGSHSGG
jgi:hypothetical protein